MKTVLLTVIITLCVVGIVYGRTSGRTDSSAIGAFDPIRLEGEWYEIARYDTPFESGLSNVTTRFTRRSDRRIDLRTEGRSIRSGRRKIRHGRITARRRCSGRLRARIFLWIHFDYNVLAADDDGGWLLVGNSSGRMLWILARDPEMTQQTLSRIVGIARQRGYNTTRLVFVDHRS